MAKGICQCFPNGAGVIQRPIHAFHPAGKDFSGNRHMVPYKEFGPLKKAEGMAPILTIIVKFRKSIYSTKSGHLD
jgi:hypothetical protein